LGFTLSHQFALDAVPFGGGQTASRKLRKAGFLACGIGLPGKTIEGDLNGLRIGTPELVRWGMTENDMPALAKLIAEGLRANDPETVAPRTATYRKRFQELHFIRQ
jgi:glycine hydroxymethyltransferase